VCASDGKSLTQGGEATHAMTRPKGVCVCVCVCVMHAITRLKGPSSSGGAGPGQEPGIRQPPAFTATSPMRLDSSPPPPTRPQTPPTHEHTRAHTKLTNCPAGSARVRENHEEVGVEVDGRLDDGRGNRLLHGIGPRLEVGRVHGGFADLGVVVEGVERCFRCAADL
jgi:hypothetical protein